MGGRSMQEVYAHGGWVIAGLAVYMAALLAIGWWASKRVTNEADFLVAGRSLGVPLTIGALVATWYGAGTTMGAAGAAYLFGTQGVVFDPYGAALCLLLIGLIFGRIVRRSKYMTLVDYFRSRYNGPVATTAGFVMVIAEMGWVGALLVGFGSIIEFFTGIPLLWGIVASTVVLVVYTYLGGMYAITLTDALQMAVITISMIAILMIVMSIPEVGGWSYIFANDPSHNWLGINQWDFFPTSEARADPDLGNAGFNYYTGHMGWFYWLAAIMAIGVGSLAAQDVNQRLMSARSENASVYAAVASSGIYLFMGLIPVVLGMAAFALFPDLEFDDVQNKLLLIMAAEYLPVIVVMIFVCGLVAALMSSAAAATLAAASIIGHNGGKFFKPDIERGGLPAPDPPVRAPGGGCCPGPGPGIRDHLPPDGGVLVATADFHLRALRLRLLLEGRQRGRGHGGDLRRLHRLDGRLLLLSAFHHGSEHRPGAWRRGRLL